MTFKIGDRVAIISAGAAAIYEVPVGVELEIVEIRSTERFPALPLGIRIPASAKIYDYNDYDETGYFAPEEVEKR